MDESLELVLTSSIGEQRDDTVNINWFVDQESMEEYFIGVRGLGFGKFASYQKVE